MSLSDGAYPRPEGRSIAPAPLIIFGVGAYLLATTDASSLQVTFLASGGLLAIAARRLALSSAHREWLLDTVAVGK